MLILNYIFACNDIIDRHIIELFALCKGGNFEIHVKSGRGLAISSAKQGELGSIYNLVKN